MRLKLRAPQSPAACSTTTVTDNLVDQSLTLAAATIELADLRVLPVSASLPQFLLVRMQAHVVAALALAATALT